MTSQEKTPVRFWISRTFTAVEDVVYVGLGLLLAGASLALLIGGFGTFIENIAGNSVRANIIPLLDRILLILLIVEVLYTVQVSFREHTIVPEPFLLVGLIAVIRRVLVITAEVGHVPHPPEELFRRFIIELVVLSLLILVLVVSLILLKRKASGEVSAERE